MVPICYRSLEELPLFPEPCALSIGTFDGVHLGHQQICSALQYSALPSVLLLFVLPPHSLLHRDIAFPGLIHCLTLRQQILHSLGVDRIYFLHFSPEIAALSYRDFVKRVRMKIPFSRLILGEGALFGHQREGTPARLAPLACAEGWALDYVPKFRLPHFARDISSTLIRLHIQRGDLDLVAMLLGRPYSILLPGGSEHFDPCICLPPPGCYTLHGMDSKLVIRSDRTFALSPVVSSSEPLWVHVKEML